MKLLTTKDESEAVVRERERERELIRTDDGHADSGSAAVVRALF